jgi:hypothetical protein
VHRTRSGSRRKRDLHQKERTNRKSRDSRPERTLVFFVDEEAKKGETSTVRRLKRGHNID